MSTVERTHDCFSCGRAVPHGKAMRYTSRVELSGPQKRAFFLFKRVRKVTRYSCGDCYVSRTTRDLLAKLPDVLIVVAILCGVLYAVH